MVNFNDAITLLIETGFTNVLAPFILIFAIVFAILQKSKIFHGGANEDDSARKINAVIAFVFGIFAVISVNVVDFIAESIAAAAMAVVVILCALLVIGLLLGDKYASLLENSKLRAGIAAIVAFLTVIFILSVLNVWGFISEKLSFTSSGIDSGTLGMIVLFLIVVGSLFWITKSSKNDD